MYIFCNFAPIFFRGEENLTNINTNNTNVHILERYPTSKLLKIYAMPAILNMLVVALYNVVDRIFVGQGAGPMAICGLALTLPCLALFSTVGTLTGVGAAGKITNAAGNNDYKQAQHILGNALFLNVAVSIILAIITLAFIKPVLKNFGGSDETISHAVTYLNIMIPAGIIGNINFTLSNTIRLVESRRKIMTIMMSGPFMNILISPIFIFALNMGIKGAGWGSAISMLFTFILLVAHLRKRQRKIRLYVSNFIPKFSTLTAIIGSGMAPFIMHITTSMVNIIINRYLIIHGGDYAVGAFGIIASMLFLIAAGQQGICQGMQQIISYNYGVGNTARVKETLTKSIIAASLISIIGFVLIELFAESIMRSFTTNAALIAIGVEGFKYTTLLLPLTGFQLVTTSFFQAIKQPAKAITINISRQFLFLIPALIILSSRMGLEGIWLATPIADGLVIIPTALILTMSPISLSSRQQIR